jgi:hypothetical protein
MVERYMKTVDEHLRKIVLAHQRDWDERLPIFLLANKASTHEPTGMTPANIVFGWELRLPCDLLFSASPDKEQSSTDHGLDLADRFLDNHHHNRQHLKVASDRMKARCDRLANSPGFQEGDKVWLYRPTRTRGKSPAPAALERPVHGDHPDQRRGLPDPAYLRTETAWPAVPSVTSVCRVRLLETSQLFWKQ